MSQMSGADVSGLRHLAQQMQSSGQRLQQIAAETAGAVSRSAWHGPDSASFTHEWNASLRPSLSRVAESLSRVGQALQTQANEQERASSASGLGGSFPGGGGSSGGPSTGGNGTGAQCRNGVPAAFNSFFGSPGWLATSAAVGLTGIKLDSLLAAGAFKAGADGGPGLWALTKMGYPTQAPGWLDEATGMLYESAKFGKTGQALYAAHGVARGFGYLGVGAGLVQMWQAGACGGPDAGWAVADGAISTGLAVMSLVPGPVGIAGTVLSIGWGAAQQLTGGKPVTKAIADGVSSVWHSLFG